MIKHIFLIIWQRIIFICSCQACCLNYLRSWLFSLLNFVFILTNSSGFFSRLVSEILQNALIMFIFTLFYICNENQDFFPLNFIFLLEGKEKKLNYIMPINANYNAIYMFESIQVSLVDFELKSKITWSNSASEIGCRLSLHTNTCQPF